MAYFPWSNPGCDPGLLAVPPCRLLGLEERRRGAGELPEGARAQRTLSAANSSHEAARGAHWPESPTCPAARSSCSLEHSLGSPRTEGRKQCEPASLAPRGPGLGDLSLGCTSPEVRTARQGVCVCMCVCVNIWKRDLRFLQTSSHSGVSACSCGPFSPKPKGLRIGWRGLRHHQTRGCSRKVTALLGHSIAPIPASHVPRVRSLMFSA